MRELLAQRMSFGTGKRKERGQGGKRRERTEEQETHVGELFISWQGPGGQ